ncbi:zinc finger protein 184-like [Mya arenaria]|uniref:zinc finger protein 184-like n=1 Tax=Mya arenaria TaxID=6604 RepID=UPI0022E72919|nr:zinc finger protein 184-like [Mya arenaria]XP_052772395.1 zinc finger protein 184-like [Mya arenaria]
MDGDGSSLLGLPIVGACLLDDVGLTSSHGGRNRGGRQRAVDSLLPDPDHQTNNIATIESGGMDFEFVSSDLVPVPEFSIDNSSVFGISETGMSESERDCDDLLKDTQCFTSSGVCRPGDQLTSGGVAVLPSSAVMEMYRSVGLRLQIIPLNNLQYISTIQTSTGMHILAVPSGTSVSDLGRLVESPNVSILDSCELETTQECNSNVSNLCCPSLHCGSYLSHTDGATFTSSQSDEITTVKDMCKTLVTPNVGDTCKNKSCTGNHTLSKWTDNEAILNLHAAGLMNGANLETTNKSVKMVSLLNCSDIKKVKISRKTKIQLTIPVKTQNNLKNKGEQKNKSIEINFSSENPETNVQKFPKSCVKQPNFIPLSKVEEIDGMTVLNPLSSSEKEIPFAIHNHQSSESEPLRVIDEQDSKLISYLSDAVTKSETADVGINNCQNNPKECFLKCLRCPAKFMRKGNLKRHTKTHVLFTDSEINPTNPINTSENLTKFITCNSNKMELNCKKNPCTEFSSTNKIKSCDMKLVDDNLQSSKSDETTTSSLEFENEETELSKYECELCQMKFISHGNLTRHLLTHSKSLMLQGRYSCKICGRGFLQRCDLTRHQLTHTHQFPYTCELCRKGFVRRSDLLVHRQYHEGKKNHLCSHCSKSYFKKGDLLRHVRHSHSDSCSLTCDTCGQPYNSRKSLQLHVRLKHA